MFYGHGCKAEIHSFRPQGTRANKYVWTKDELKALATCFVGGKDKINKIVSEFSDTHKNIPKSQVNTHARDMTVYERRAGDTKKYWYLKKESLEQHGIEVGHAKNCKRNPVMKICLLISCDRRVTRQPAAFPLKI